MRSRYSAYALGVTDYIMNTTYRENPEYRKNAKLWRQSLADYCRTTRFLGLTVLDGEPGDSTATVTFQARLEIGGKTFLLTEKSRFVKLGKRWLYHSGQPDLALTGDQGN
jgi:SEC-C motif-containing protein